ncbi:MAG: hypothetical protein J7501_06825 [Bdellovibrio sp.]|nr:hypothetical protein [Bdellovibrio sp.]
MRILLLLLFISTLAGSFAFAKDKDREDLEYKGLPNWSEFRGFVLEQQREDERLGLSYMISGGLAAVGGVVGYNLAEDPFSRSVYAITSTVGIAAIGLGASYYWTGNEYDSFYYALEHANISIQEKNAILKRYLEKERQWRENRRWIRVATHALIAVANFYSAAQEENSDVKSVFYFLGAANTVMAISYTF